MLKDVMVRLDGGAADTASLAAAATVAGLSEGSVTGLFLNLLPLSVPMEGDDIGGIESIEKIDRAREVGDRIETALKERVSALPCPAGIRRRDVFPSEIADAATREARLADVFVTQRPHSAENPPETQRLVEGILFGSGRHVLLVPPGGPGLESLDHVVVGWNASRESVRALAEAAPYLHKARSVTLAVVDGNGPTSWISASGRMMAERLRRRGIDTSLREIESHRGDVASALTEVAREAGAQLLAVGGYGHTRLREWLLGGVTDSLLRHASLPLLLAH